MASSARVVVGREDGRLCEVKIERGWVVRHMTCRLLGRARPSSLIG
jgi:hypothetical protein